MRSFPAGSLVTSQALENDVSRGSIALVRGRTHDFFVVGL